MFRGMDMTHPKAIRPILTAAGFTAEVEHTGGGCMALAVPLPDGQVVVATDDGGSRIEVGPEDQVMLGLYTHAQWYGPESGENAPILVLPLDTFAADPKAAIAQLQTLTPGMYWVNGVSS